MTQYNSLAEIQRCCRKVWDSTDGPRFLDVPIEQWTEIPHPTEDFHILTDGAGKYLVRDGDMQTLYEVIQREPVKVAHIGHGHVSPLQKISLPEAVEVLCDVLREDISYRFSWLSNIAVAFIDEYRKANPHMSDGNKEILHRIANTAAENFLDMLLSQRPSEEVKPAKPTPDDTDLAEFPEGYTDKTRELSQLYRGMLFSNAGTSIAVGGKDHGKTWLRRFKSSKMKITDTYFRTGEVVSNGNEYALVFRPEADAKIIFEKYKTAELNNSKTLSDLDTGGGESNYR